MKKFLLLLAAGWMVSNLGAQQSLDHLLCENRTNPIGVGTLLPRFSWQLHSDKRNIMQAAYEIHVSETKADIANGRRLTWNSGKIFSDQSVQVVYAGQPLQPGKKYFWQVKVWDNAGRMYSGETAYWQMGLLRPEDWKAKWIGIGYQEPEGRPSPQFRKTFTAQRVTAATLYITSYGMYQAFLNGEKIGKGYLTPGWTSFNKRLQYQAYDVTPLVKEGTNAIGVLLGNGWYRGTIGFSGHHNVYGKDLGLLLQLDLTYSDGTTASILSDGSWKCSAGPIRYSEIYNGETYDARQETPGWLTSAFDDQKWTSARELDLSKNNLVPTVNELVEKQEVFHPVKIFRTPKGELVADFGQNLVGWAQIRVKGRSGDSIRLSHAEVLDKYGNFYTENLRAAKAEDTYILKGGAEEVFEPHFTWQGFRYVKVEGSLGELKPEQLSAVALYSNMPATGNFSCSNALLNQLQHNIQWGQRGNFLDVPTDCPQRDERLGWTGDAQVFSRTAAFNRNVNNFFYKWLKDVAADQTKEGSVPFVVPNVIGEGADGAAGWADVATIIPWNMYLVYADTRLLDEQYPSMKAWVDNMQKGSVNGLWMKGRVFGDWLFYRPFDDNDGRSAVTDKALISQAFFAYSTELLIKAAAVLKKQTEVAQYQSLLKQIKEAFAREFVTPSGRLVSNTQTAYVLALQFDLLPESLRPKAVETLVQNIHDYGDHLTTGFLGTPYLCHVLTRFGHSDVAYKLLLQQTYPSWLYPVKMGATTIWERWDGQKPDSTFETPGMNSFNHYAYGAIGDWMYRVITGLDTYEQEPGYKHISIMPHPGGDLTFADASLETYYGRVESGWKIENNRLVMNVTIPSNTRATIFIPAKGSQTIKESGHPLTSVKEINEQGQEGEYRKVELGSGKYMFTVE